MGDIINIRNEEHVITQELIEDARYAAAHPPINHYKAKENIWIHINKDLEAGITPLSGGIEELIKPDTFFFMQVSDEKRSWYLDYYKEIEDDINSIVSIIKGTKDKPDNRLQEFVLEHIKIK